MSNVRVAIVGACAGIVVVGVVVVLAVSGVFGPARGDARTARGDALCALVLPDENGVVRPRVIDVVSRTATGWVAVSVSPTLSAVVPGTSGHTLADAYTFGGGSGLLDAYNASGHGRVEHWVTVDAAGWSRLAGTESLSLDIPRHMEVFDGRRLVTFEAGPASVPASEAAVLLDGVDYLDPSDAARVREQVGRLLLGFLSSGSAGSFAQSDLSAPALRDWTGDLKTIGE